MKLDYGKLWEIVGSYVRQYSTKGFYFGTVLLIFAHTDTVLLTTPVRRVQERRLCALHVNCLSGQEWRGMSRVTLNCVPVEMCCTKSMHAQSVTINSWTLSE